MSAIAPYYNNAELAMASYANLVSGVPDTQALEDEDIGMSSRQAKAFSENWRVIDQQQNTDSGFSATVFERIDESGNQTGEYTIAIRGSESLSDDWKDWLDANESITLGEGIAIKQAKIIGDRPRFSIN